MADTGWPGLVLAWLQLKGWWGDEQVPEVPTNDRCRGEEGKGEGGE